MKTTSFLAMTAALSLLAGASAAIADPVDLNIDDINQITKNYGVVVNFGDLDMYGGGITGNGSSVSVSATGAVSSASASFINAPEYDSIAIGKYGFDEVLLQDTYNSGNITNTNSGNSSFNTGVISGDGASANVSATGAASAVSISTINNTGAGVNQDVDLGGINQITENGGAINNYGGNITVSTISGSGASASISGSGSISAISVSDIEGSQQLGDITVTADINQNTTNHGAIYNTGAVDVNAITGHGSSVSISAIGAASSVSVSSIK